MKHLTNSINFSAHKRFILHTFLVLMIPYISKAQIIIEPGSYAVDEYDNNHTYSSLLIDEDGSLDVYSQSQVVFDGLDMTSNSNLYAVSTSSIILQSETIIADNAEMLLVVDPAFFSCENPNARMASNSETEQTQLGDEEYTVTESLLVYPNPFRDAFHIGYMNEGKATEISVRIVDLSGRIVLQEKYELQSFGDSNILTVDASSLIAGAYIYELVTDTRKIKSGRLIKQ